MRDDVTIQQCWWWENERKKVEQGTECGAEWVEARGILIKFQHLTTSQQISFFLLYIVWRGYLHSFFFFFLSPSSGASSSSWCCCLMLSSPFSHLWCLVLINNNNGTVRRVCVNGSQHVKMNFVKFSFFLFPTFPWRRFKLLFLSSLYTHLEFSIFKFEMRYMIQASERLDRECVERLAM